VKRKTKITAMAVGSGVFYVFMTCLWYALDPLIYSMGLDTIVFHAVVAGVIYGIPIGLLCSLIGVFCFHRKNLATVAKAMFIVLGSVATGFAMLGGPTPLGGLVQSEGSGVWVLAAFFPAFCFTSVILWRCLPDVSEQRWPVCGNCAYNFTGNTSGICPECGTKVEPPQK